MTVVPIVPLTLASRVGENGRGDGDGSQRAEPTGMERRIAGAATGPVRVTGPGPARPGPVRD